MIKTVIITNHRGETLTLELANPYSSGFAVTNIGNLGPNKATINTTDIVTNDGSVFNSARVDPRNITLTLKFMGDSASEIERQRQMTYKFFQLKKKITFEVITDERHVSIEGYTESNEPAIFSSKESTSISIICPYPYFKSVGKRNEVSFYGEEPAFEFPFCNNENGPELEFGYIHIVTDANVEYSGEAEVGILITIHALGEAKNISIYNVDNGESMKINVRLEHGDDVVISTVKNDKYVRFYRNGECKNILNCIDKNANWFSLSQGNNVFAYTAEEGLQNLKFTIQNDILYEGV